MNRILMFVLCSFAAATLAACSKDGPVEKAGEKVDEAIEKVQHGDEGALEKTGRKIDEAADEAKEDLED